MVARLALFAAVVSVVIWLPRQKFTTAAPAPAPAPATAPAQTRFLDFYKLSLQWPASTCSIQTCITPYKDQFTIHGLWPQYLPDTPVPPWRQNSNCVNGRPVQPPVAIKQLTAGTIADLTTQWPELVDYKTPAANRGFWEEEWRKHGMCAAWPTKPEEYFSVTLRLKKDLEANGDTIRAVIAGAGIIANGSLYEAGDVAAALTTKFKATPEIACLKLRTTKVIVLWEIRFCYGKDAANGEPDALMDCPTPFSNFGCSSKTRISFPPP